MGFSVLEWMVSKSLDLSLIKSFASLNGIQTRLNKTADEWAKKLPASCSIVSVAMYLNIHSNNESDTSLKAICEKLEKSQLPSSEFVSCVI
jgi:hypothetical protein